MTRQTKAQGLKSEDCKVFGLDGGVIIPTDEILGIKGIVLRSIKTGFEVKKLNVFL